MNNVLNFNINGADDLNKTVTDLMASNEGFYLLADKLNTMTDTDASRIIPREFVEFVGYLDTSMPYSMAEVLYMAQRAMEDIEDDKEDASRPLRIEVEDPNGNVVYRFNTVEELRDTAKVMTEDDLQELYPYAVYKGGQSVSITFDGATI